MVLRHPVLLWTSVALVVIGLAGVAFLGVSAPNAPSGTPTPRGGSEPGWPGSASADAIADLGERIFTTGEGENGRIPRSAVGPGMMSVGCADCHGSDGRGRTVRLMMGTFKTPDIRLSALLSETDQTWTRDAVGTAIREGTEPNGQQLDRYMPRWSMTDSELEAVLRYLEELSNR